MHLTWLPVVNILSRLLAPLPTPNPHYHFRKKKNAACTYFSYSLLIMTRNDVLRCGIMKLVEQKEKKKLNVVLSCA